MDEKLIGIRREASRTGGPASETGDDGVGHVDIEALTAQALAHLAKFREVLAQRSIHEKKEFLRGLVAGITLFPSENRGVITFYDLIPASFKCSAGTLTVAEKMQVWWQEERFRWEGERCWVYGNPQLPRTARKSQLEPWYRWGRR